MNKYFPIFTLIFLLGILSCELQNGTGNSNGLWDSFNPNLSLIAQTIYNYSLNENKPVVFTARSGLNSFSDGDPSQNDGVCQVCHTQTFYHLADGSGLSHNEGTNCTECHLHREGLMPTGGGSCTSCHGQPPAGWESDG